MSRGWVHIVQISLLMTYDSLMEGIRMFHFVDRRMTAPPTYLLPQSVRICWGLYQVGIQMTSRCLILLLIQLHRLQHERKRQRVSHRRRQTQLDSLDWINQHELLPIRDS
jgi:hypothetical protein